MSNANIHGFGDDNDNNNDNEPKDNNRYYSPDNTTPIFDKYIYKGDPRNQSIISFLKEAICPLFQFKSFSFIVIIINIVVYIASCIPHGLEENELGMYFLPPSYTTLDLLGDLSGRKIREKPYQSYRWITNNFLHMGFEHIFLNCLSILIIGTLLEYLIGTWKYMAIYFISGILGSLFSVLTSPNDSSVGASISICGLITALLGFYIINWNRLTVIFGIENKCLIVALPLVMSFMSMPLAFSTYSGSGVDHSQNRINYMGHLGGLIFGFFSSFIFIKPKDESDTCCFTDKVWFYTGIVVCSLFAAIGFPCFYFLDHFK